MKKIFTILLIFIFFSGIPLFIVISGKTINLPFISKKGMGEVEIKEAVGGLEVDAPKDLETLAVNYSIAAGDTLFSLLLNHGLSREEAQSAVNAFSRRHDPRKIRVGSQFSAYFSGEQNSLTSFFIQVEPTKEIWVVREEEGRFSSEERIKALLKKQTRVDGAIDSTLYGAALQAGLPLNTLSELIYLYSFDVDFQREIQTGDTFSVLFEDFTDEQGKRVKLGDIIYAGLTINGKKREIYRYTTEEGNADYFDYSGKSARKTLLKTPIHGAHITSGYGMRVSPILGYSRFHPALDFAAPEGTPVFTAGDGLVKEIGYDDVYGRYVRISHANGYSTLYAHLSYYVKGLRWGARVVQGSVIGFVGSTGMSTGPHLHYEVLYQGKHINPGVLNFPPGKTLKGAELERFKEARSLIKLEYLEKGCPEFGKFKKNILP